MKAIKIYKTGSGIAQKLPFTLRGINPARDNISWSWSIISTLSSSSSIYWATILDWRYGSNKKGVCLYKNNLYSGSGILDPNDYLTLNGPISSHKGHHSETPPNPIILLSA